MKRESKQRLSPNTLFERKHQVTSCGTIQKKKKLQGVGVRWPAKSESLTCYELLYSCGVVKTLFIFSDKT